MSTTTNDEQYHAGFEAWARDKRYDLTKCEDGSRIGPAGSYKSTATAHAWEVWTASKREASTEPSAWMCPAAVEPEFTADALLAGYWMRKGRTVTPLYAGAGALPDEAKDAALTLPPEPTEQMRQAVYMALQYDMSVQDPDEWGAADKAIAAVYAAIEAQVKEQKP